jgi:hypothetical protein
LKAASGSMLVRVTIPAECAVGLDVAFADKEAVT